MYSTPRHVMPTEVVAFQHDIDALGMICDSDHWYVTAVWAERFQKHLENLLPVATAGNPWAQYNLGTLYASGCLYYSWLDYEKNYEKDIALASTWLEKAACQGFVAAVDNLVVIGVGEEAERLRAISKELQIKSPELIGRWEENPSIPVVMPSFFEAVWEIAYGNGSPRSSDEAQRSLG